MLDLYVVGDDQGRRPRHREDLSVSVINTAAQRRRREVHLDLGNGEFGVVRVIDDLDEEESHPEGDER
jgi:hypothetical protein